MKHKTDTEQEGAGMNQDFKICECKYLPHGWFALDGPHEFVAVNSANGDIVRIPKGIGGNY